MDKNKQMTDRDTKGSQRRFFFSSMSEPDLEMLRSTVPPSGVGKRSTHHVGIAIQTLFWKRREDNLLHTHTHTHQNITLHLGIAGCVLVPPDRY